MRERKESRTEEKGEKEKNIRAEEIVKAPQQRKSYASIQIHFWQMSRTLHSILAQQTNHLLLCLTWIA